MTSAKRRETSQHDTFDVICHSLLCCTNTGCCTCTSVFCHWCPVISKWSFPRTVSHICTVWLTLGFPFNRHIFCTLLQVRIGPQSRPLGIGEAGFFQTGCLFCRSTNSIKAVKNVWLMTVWWCSMTIANEKANDWLLPRDFLLNYNHDQRGSQ